MRERLYYVEVSRVGQEHFDHSPGPAPWWRRGWYVHADISYSECVGCDPPLLDRRVWTQAGAERLAAKVIERDCRERAVVPRIHRVR